MKAMALALLGLGLCLGLGCGPESSRRVLVANRDLGAGQRLEPTDWIARPLSGDRSIAWVEEADAALVTGRILRADLPEGSPVTWSLLDPGDGAAPVSGRVPPGLLAMSLWVEGAAWVKPHDFVDVLVSFHHAERAERVSHLLLQDLPVLEVGPSHTAARDAALVGGSARPERIRERRLTVLLHPAEAPLLCLAYGLGPVHVALRNPDDRGLADPSDRTTVERLLEQTRKPQPPSEIPGLSPSERLDPPGSLR